MKKILIIQAHPDGRKKHYCHALADAYASAAVEAGHKVTTIDLGTMEIPLLRSKEEWENDDALPEFITDAQQAIASADHLLIVYPLWLGTMPAVLKAWLEQVFRSSFIFDKEDTGKWINGRLIGRSARIVVTMGMPGLIYRWFFFAHSLKSLERNILKITGIKPVRHSIIGFVENQDGSARKKWIAKMRELGRAGR